MKIVIKVIGVIATLGVFYLAYYLFIVPVLIDSQAKDEIKGFTAREKSKEQIIAGGKYFGEKYEIEFLNKEQKLLWPYRTNLSKKDYYGVNVNILFSKDAPLLEDYNRGPNLDCYAMRAYSSPQDKQQSVNEDAALLNLLADESSKMICGEGLMKVVIRGVAVEEYIKDGKSYLCAQTEKTKNELISETQMSQSKIESGFNAFTWYRDRLREFPKLTHSENGAVIPNKGVGYVGISNSLFFEVDKEMLLDSLQSSDLYKCETKCEDYLCKKKSLATFKKI